MQSVPPDVRDLLKALANLRLPRELRQREPSAQRDKAPPSQHSQKKQSPKKIHEVERLSARVAQLAEGTGSRCVVDAGAVRSGEHVPRFSTPQP